MSKWISNNKTAKGTKKSIFSWSSSDDELRFQVEKYNSLPWTETFRGGAVIFLGALLCLTIVLGLFGVISLDSGTLVEAVIYAVCFYFILRGHRWAIILAMVLWTGDKAYQLYLSASSGQSNVGIIIVWWLIVMPYLYKALKVENLRRNSATPSLAAATANSNHFCRNCGGRLEDNAKFCSNCGKPIK